MDMKMMPVKIDSMHEHPKKLIRDMHPGLNFIKGRRSRFAFGIERAVCFAGLRCLRISHLLVALQHEFIDEHKAQNNAGNEDERFTPPPSKLQAACKI